MCINGRSTASAPSVTHNQTTKMQKWKHSFEEIEGNLTKHKLSINSRNLTNFDFIENIAKSNSFCEFLSQILQESKFKAYFFEVKPFSKKSINSEFEFVLVNSPTLLKIKSDKSNFEKYFIEEKNVVTFFNLGKDAKLIVPTNISNEDNYSHLAKFVRNAPPNQLIEFWKNVGTECKEILRTNPIWLSTAGLGVSWLHLRIDSRPKYYRYKPYKNY